MDQISELERRFRELEERLLAREITVAEYRAAVEQLRFVDDQGRRWKMEPYSGHWYYNQDGIWVRGSPATASTDSAVEHAPSWSYPWRERFRFPNAPQGTRAWSDWLLAGIVLLAVASFLFLLLRDRARSFYPLTPTRTSPLVSIDRTVVIYPSENVSPAAITRSPQPSPSFEVASTTPVPVVRVTAISTSQTAPAQGTGTATFVPETATRVSGFFVFPVFDPQEQTYHIYRATPDGTRQVLVHQASQPHLTRDGQRLAYRSWDKYARQLIARDTLGGPLWPFVSAEAAARPSWSPDRQVFVYHSRQEPDHRSRIYRMDGIDAMVMRRHGANIFGQMPNWLPDGRIIYQTCEGGSCGLFIMNADGSFPTQVTYETSDTAPEPSPDGRQIVFMSQQNNNWDVYLVNVDGSDRRQLTSSPANDGLPVWSPDGRWLAFVSDRDGEWAIWLMRPDGSEQQRLFSLGGSLDGRVQFAKPYETQGWVEERIAWGP